MNRHWSVFVILLATSVATHAGPRLLENVPLQWRPTSELRLGSVQMAQVQVQFEPFKDTRQNPQSIGENDEDNSPKPVTTTDDAGAFVSAHMRELFNRAGIKTVDNGAAITIQGEVREFFVRETTTYKSVVTVHLTLVGTNGTMIWSGAATGDADRFGRSYKLENYYETLSDAIVNITSSLLQSAQFQQALATRP